MMRSVFNSVKIMAGISTVSFCDAKEEPKLSRAERRRLEAEALDREQNALFGANYSKMQSYLKQQSDQFDKQKKARDSFREEYKKVADSKKIAYNIEKKIEMDADTAMLLHTSAYARDVMLSKTDDEEVYKYQRKLRRKM